MPLALHDIDDAEGFVAAIVNRPGLSLNADDRDDLRQFLLETAWQLSLRYDRGDPAYPPRFSVYAYSILSVRVVDWQRKRFGRTRWAFADRVYERPVAHVVSLDGSRDRLEQDLARRSGDLEVDCDPALGRLLAAGGRTRARDLERLRGKRARRPAA